MCVHPTSPRLSDRRLSYGGSGHCSLAERLRHFGRRSPQYRGAAVPTRRMKNDTALRPQTAAILTRTGSIQLELPPSILEVMPGVEWGAVEAFPTPSYWVYQVLSRRLTGRPAQFRLGRSLMEEVAACLLGGHGMPATVCMAAFEHLRQKGAFSSETPTQARLEAWLREPLLVEGRTVHYRFASQKSRYLAAALPLASAAPDFETGKQLRDWLLQMPGVGPKTASFVARNWLGADDVAILDIHIMRVGQAIGLFARNMTAEKHYFELESLFVQFAQNIDVRASELDAVIWYEMASSPTTVRHLLEHLQAEEPNAKRSRQSRQRSQAELTFA